MASYYTLHETRALTEVQYFAQCDPVSQCRELGLSLLAACSIPGIYNMGLPLYS